MTLSFTAARKTTPFATLDTASFTNSAHSPDLEFNSIIQRRDQAPHDSIFSIEPKEILNKLSQDKLTDLQKITLACSYASNGFALWDVEFNTADRRQVTACIFTAGADFMPLGSNRIRIPFTYLDQERPISRRVLSKVELGETLGIGIYDVRTHQTYALLYRISSSCMGRWTKTQSKGEDLMVPALNCDLIQAYIVDDRGEAMVVDAVADVPETPAQEPFAHHLIESARYITVSFPWKAHFGYTSATPTDLEATEMRIVTELENAPTVTYDEFETVCRETYDVGRKIVLFDKTNTPKADRKEIANPIVEIVSLGSGSYIGRIADHAGYLVGSYRFTIPEFHTAMLTERVLTNQDLIGRDSANVAGVAHLSKSKFGEAATLRYMTINF